MSMRANTDIDAKKPCYQHLVVQHSVPDVEAGHGHVGAAKFLCQASIIRLGQSQHGVTSHLLFVREWKTEGGIWESDGYCKFG